MVPVKFTRSWRMYGAGETAWFESAVSDDLVNVRKVAIFAGADKRQDVPADNKPADEQKPLDLLTADINLFTDDDLMGYKKDVLLEACARRNIAVARPAQTNKAELIALLKGRNLEGNG